MESFSCLRFSVALDFCGLLKISISSDLPLVYCNLIPLVQLAGTSEKRQEVISVTVLAHYGELYTK